MLPVPNWEQAKAGDIERLLAPLSATHCHLITYLSLSLPLQFGPVRALASAPGNRKQAPVESGKDNGTRPSCGHESNHEQS